MSRRTVGVAGATGLVVAMLAAATIWQPQGPWFGPNGRSTQTAVARTATAAARPTLTATRTRTTTPTRQLTLTRTPTASQTPTAAFTATPAITSTPTGVPPAPATPTVTPWHDQPIIPTYTHPTYTPIVPPPANLGAVWPLDEEEANYLDALNAQRASLGLRPVVPHQSMLAEAQWHASDMARLGYLSHWDTTIVQDGPGAGQTRDFGRRSNDFGNSPYANRCEIALGGSERGWDAWNVWLHSPGHNACQTDGRMVHVGIGRAWSGLDAWRWSVSLSSDMGSNWPTPTPGPWGPVP